MLQAIVSMQHKAACLLTIKIRMNPCQNTQTGDDAMRTWNDKGSKIHNKNL